MCCKIILVILDYIKKKGGKYNFSIFIISVCVVSEVFFLFIILVILDFQVSPFPIYWDGKKCEKQGGNLLVTKILVKSNITNIINRKYSF